VVFLLFVGLAGYWQVTKYNRVDGPGLPPWHGWQTYRNEQYRFEFKYPNDWFIVRTIRPTTEGQLLIVALQKTGETDGEVPVIYAEVDTEYRASQAKSSKTVNVGGEAGFENLSEDPIVAHKILFTSWPHKTLGYSLVARWSFSDKSAQSIQEVYRQNTFLLYLFL